VLSPSIVFFSSKRKKNHRTKKNSKKERSLPLSSHFALSFLAPTSTLLLLPFCFKCFLLASFSSQPKKKHTHKEKKNHRKEKKMQRREGAYLSSLDSTFGMKRSSCLFFSTFLQH